MKIVIAGGTGFIGHHLSQFLIQQHYPIVVLSRQSRNQTFLEHPHARMIQWDGRTQGPWAQECEGANVVINLSGAPIADSRWTEKRKQELIDGRVESNRTLLEAIASWQNKPHTFITASGIGFYGDSREKVVNESSTPGEGFLPQLCQMWESSAMEGEALGLRVIPIRIGMVLGQDGGALSKMTLPFRLFLGGQIRPGTQFVSWIHQQDLAKLILYIITQPSIQGPVNAVAPNPTTMKDFCQSLGKALKRPSWFPVPEFILKTALGELASMLITGQRVEPQKSLQNGFSFTYPTLPAALNEIFSNHSTVKKRL